MTKLPLPDGMASIFDSGDPRTPLPIYAGCELMHGRLRAFILTAVLCVVLDRAGHDLGDEDR